MIDTRPIELKSNLLVLKELKSNNVTKEYIDWLNNPDVNKYLESRFTYQDEKIVRKFVKKCAESKLEFLFGIFVRNGLKHIGNIKLGPINVQHNHAEIGLVIGDKKEWGKGYASTAISMVTLFGFNRIRLDKINAGCYENNIASKRAFEKSGYQVEGIIRNNVISIHGRESVYKLGCTKADVEKQSI